MSLFYGYKKLKSDMSGKRDTTGGEITRDINIGSNHILTSADPTQNTHLARKKYVDDKVSSASAPGQRSGFLLKSGGTMTGDIDLGKNKIFTTSDPVSDKDLARKKYVDDQDAKKLSTTGGTMTGNVTIGNNKIVSTSDPTDEKPLARKKYVDYQNNILKKDIGFSMLKDNFSLKFHNLFLVEYDSAYDLLFERNGGKVKEVVDYGIEGNNFKQATKSLQPSLCLESEKEDNKYFLKFNSNRMISDSNINAATGKKIL